MLGARAAVCSCDRQHGKYFKVLLEWGCFSFPCLSISVLGCHCISVRFTGNCSVLLYCTKELFSYLHPSSSAEAKLFCQDYLSIAFGGCSAACCVVPFLTISFIFLQILSSSHLYLKLSQVAHVYFKKIFPSMFFLLLVHTHNEEF